MMKSILKLQPSVSNRSLKLQCHAYNQYGHTSKVKAYKVFYCTYILMILGKDDQAQEI